MRELIKVLLPYCLRHKRAYVAGILVVLLSNYLTVEVIEWIRKALSFLFDEAEKVDAEEESTEDSEKD